MEAFVGSVENQKAGALHLHAQLFVQCLHQHTPLHHVLRKIRETQSTIVDEYLAYVDHVCKTTYDDKAAADTSRDSREQAWPEYSNDASLLSKPSYMGMPAFLKGDTFAKLYKEDIQRVQERDSNIMFM